MSHSTTPTSTPKNGQVIEEHFRRPNADLRVIVATTTLAMGINTPASSVVVAGLEHPGNESYSVAEYKIIIGRAGRLGFSERGASYLIALTPQYKEQAWQGYVLGRPEDVMSRFLATGTDPRSLVLRGFGGNAEVRNPVADGAHP